MVKTLKTVVLVVVVLCVGDTVAMVLEMLIVTQLQV